MVTKEQDEIYFELKKISNLYARKVIQNKVVFPLPYKLTRSQALMIAYIIEHREKEKIYQRDIEKFFSIRRSTATEQLKRLEALGLIERKQSKLDQRLKEIVLTEKALSINFSIKQDMQKLSSTLFDGVTPEEIKVLKKILVKMGKNLEDK